jgi:uncharacterized protein YjaZ
MASYKNKALDTEAIANIKIKIVKYRSPEKLLEFMWDTTIAELKKSEHGGVDGEGKQHKYTFKQLIDSIRENGCYGCAYAGKNEIHIWIGKNAKAETVLELLAHERGHLMAPQYKNDMRDEIKAESYALCASFAFSVLRDLGKVTVD